MSAGREAMVEHLTVIADFMEATRFPDGKLPEGYAYVTLERLMLDKAEHFVSAELPDDVERGEMGDCFKNALLLANERRDLDYVEGYGSSEFLPAILHAWCVDEGGRVVDPTWPDSADRHYFGLRIDTAVACRIVVEAEVYGVIPNDWMREHSIMRTGEIEPEDG